MAIFLILTGAYLMIVGIRDKQSRVATLVKGDFSGANSFIPWVFAIIVIGAIGYVDDLRPLSDGLLILILVVLMLHNGTGFFPQLFSDLGINKSGQAQLPSLSGGLP